MESLASMAANKPPRQWVDSDIDRTTVELAELAQSFKRHEAFAHVHGRQDHRLAMAVVVGLNGQPIHDEFEITSSEERQVGDLIRRFRGALQDSGEEEQTSFWQLLQGSWQNTSRDEVQVLQEGKMRLDDVRY